MLRKWGDTGREIQLILVEEALEERPDVDYIVGSAVTAGAAVSLLRARGLTGRIRVLADYFTHAVYRGIKREKILAAPTDFPALQGRMGIEMAVRLLEGKLEHPHAGPLIHIVEQGNLDDFSTRLSLAPADFSPDIRGRIAAAGRSGRARPALTDARQAATAARRECGALAEAPAAGRLP